MKTAGTSESISSSNSLYFSIITFLLVAVRASSNNLSAVIFT